MSDVNFYHSVPNHTLLTLDDRKVNESVVEKKVSFINRTHKDVTVCERSNLKFTLPAAPIFGRDQQVIIRVEYYFNNEKVKNNTELLLDGLQNLGEQLKAFKDAFSCEANKRLYGGIDFVVEYALPVSVFDDCGKTIYFKEIDIVVSLEHLSNCPDHPFSSDKDFFQPNHEYNGFSIDITINDPSMLYGNRYVNVLNDIHLIVPEKDLTKRSGVYLNKSLGGNRKTIRYDFSNADENLHLFRTYDESLTNGNTDILLKKELALLENNNLTLKRELEEIRTVMQKSELEMDARKRQLDLEREELETLRAKQDHDRKLRMEEIKDEYEKRSYIRKDSSEGLKFIPAVVVGLGALFVGLKSIFT